MRDYEECRPYVEHLLAEHRRLHSMLTRAKRAIRSDGGSTLGWAWRTYAILSQVRDELRQHFEEEEGGGCMDEAVSRCPRLAAELRRIEAEHPEILLSLDRLIADVMDGTNSVEDRATLSHQFDELCRQLHAHEAAENELLRRGFGCNVNIEEEENGHVPVILDV